MAYKMKGHSLPGPNQRQSPAKDIQTFEASDPASKWNAVTSHNEAHKAEKAKEKKKPTPAKQGVLMSDEKKYGTIKEQQKANTAFTKQREQFEKMRREGLTDKQRAIEDSTSAVNRKGLRDAMKPKKKKGAKRLKPIKSTTSNKSMVSRQERKEKSPAKCPLIAALPAITAGISAIGAMKKKKEE